MSAGVVPCTWCRGRGFIRRKRSRSLLGNFVLDTVWELWPFAALGLLVICILVLVNSGMLYAAWMSPAVKLIVPALFVFLVFGPLIVFIVREVWGERISCPHCGGRGVEDGVHKE